MENVIVTGFTPQDTLKITHRKTKHFIEQYTLFDTTAHKETVILRLYATERATYACVWVLGKMAAAGSGSACGWGYCKKSAACASALRSAGFKFNLDLDGVGMGKITEALHAIADYLQLESYAVIEAGA